MNTSIISKFPKKVKKMKDFDISSFVIGIAICLVIFGFTAIYIVTNPKEDVPMLKAEPIVTEQTTTYEIPKVLSGGHETVEVETVEEISEVAELPVEETKRPTLTDDEIVARVVHQEAKGESLIGQVAVAITVYNRCDFYGKTVESVVFEPDQFSYDPDVKPYDSCFRAVVIAKLIKDFAPDLFPKTMMWFAAGGYHTGEHCGKPFIQIGNHYFNYLPESEE